MKLNFACCLIGLFVIGCTPSQPIEKKTTTVQSQEHATATTLPAAMKQLNANVETIVKAFTEKKPDDAHNALHDIDHLFVSIPALAKDMSEEKQSVIKKSVDELKESFGALDETLHGGPETPYTKVEERITAAMAGLRKAIE